MIVQLSFILAGGHIVDERFSTEPEFRLTYVRFSLDIKTHFYPLEIIQHRAKCQKIPIYLILNLGPWNHVQTLDFTCFLILLLD